MADDDLNDFTVDFVDKGAQVRVNSSVLALASPVFRAMLASNMSEAASKRVELKELGSPEGFLSFYMWLVPFGSAQQKLTLETIDDVLVFADYYEVGPLKEQCEQFLLTLEPSIKRLLQSEKHGLSKLRQKCVAHVSTSIQEDLALLKSHPDLLLEVAQHLRARATSEALARSSALSSASLSRTHLETK
uniref:Tramtrack n=1 Tax=Pfiesteria piscicida TaxID=71001 RepID=A3E3B2_PFIPI|nr:tramtrack [Pfiesteria piscicida]